MARYQHQDVESILKLFELELSTLHNLSRIEKMKIRKRVDRSQHELTPDQVELAINFPQIIKQAETDVMHMIKRLAGEDVQEKEEKKEP